MTGSDPLPNCERWAPPRFCKRYAEDQCPECWAYWYFKDWDEYEVAMKASPVVSLEVLHRAWHRWWDGHVDYDKASFPCKRCP